jgi:nicotinamide-nucleotide amidase
MPLFKLIWLRRRRFSCQRIGDGMFGYNVRMNSDPEQLTKQLASALLHAQQKICTAESCTGGLIAKTFTDLAGSSDWFERGFVTYSDQAKSEMLAVPVTLIEDYGAVSEAVATAMASGALRHSRADFSVAVTGVAGPGGGSDEKPVGTVWIAVASAEQMLAKHYKFDGDRQAVRVATLEAAIELLLDLVESD